MMIPTGIDDNADQPGGEFRLSLECVDFFDKRAANLLRNVLCICVRPGQAPGNPMNAVVMTLQQVCKGVTVAGDCAFDQLDIAIVRSTNARILVASRRLLPCRMPLQTAL